MLHEVWFQKDLNPCVNKTFPPDIALEQLEDTSLCFVHHAFGIFLLVILNGLALDYRAPHCSGLAVKATRQRYQWNPESNLGNEGLETVGNTQALSE